MKSIAAFLLLFSISMTYGQVKIGDNINTIDAASIMELESASKVFVVTRVTTIQMNTITPLNGALVYNTDDNCLFQFNNGSWSSLCVNVSAGETITVLVDNSDGTFTYTNEAGTDVTISQASLQNNGDGTYSFMNGGGTITIIDTNAASNLYNNTTSGLTANNVQDAIDELNTAVNTSNTLDLDMDPTNELSDVALTGTTLELTNPEAGATGVDLDATFATDAEIASFEVTDVINGHLIATITEPDGTPAEIDETITSLASPADAESTLVFSDEAGGTTTIPNIVRSVNGVNPAANGNVAVVLSSVSTGLEAALPATGIDADVYIVSGEVAPNADRNGVAFIYDDPTGWQEVTTDLATADARYVNIIGDAMTGPLAMGNNSITGVNDPVNPQDAATKNYVDGLAVGDITSTDITVGGGTDAAFNNVTLTIADDAIDRTKINPNVAGTGLTQAANGSLEIDPTTATGDGNISSSSLTVTGETDALLGDVTLEITPGANDQVLTTDNVGALAWVDSSTLNHTGTTGSLFFAGATGDPSENNSQLFWDSANNRLGIGTNTPTHKLQVTGQVRATSFANADGTANAPSYRFNNDGNTGMYRAATDELGLSTAGVEALRIDPSGNIGIGTSTPDEALQVAGNMRLDGSFEDKDGDAGTAGQVLSTTATGTDWVDANGVGTDSQNLSNSVVTANESVEIQISGGNNTTINIQDADSDITNELTDLSLAGNTLTLTNPATGSNSVTLPSADGSETLVSAGTDIGVTGTGITGDPYIIANTFTEVDASITNEIQTLSISGNDLTISGTGGNTVTLPSFSETTTNLSQNAATGVITYANEASASQTANVVGAETDNSITSGANGGAYFESPIKAFGKIAATGALTRVTPGITITKLGTGRYRVNLPAGLVSDQHYIIQLSQPGRGGSGNDDPGISYNTPTAASFEVIIGDNDNGGTDRSRYDSEFMFTILDL